MFTDETEKKDLPNCLSVWGDAELNQIWFTKPQTLIGHGQLRIQRSHIRHAAATSRQTREPPGISI